MKEALPATGLNELIINELLVMGKCLIALLSIKYLSQYRHNKIDGDAKSFHDYAGKSFIFN